MQSCGKDRKSTRGSENTSIPRNAHLGWGNLLLGEMPEGGSPRRTIASSQQPAWQHSEKTRGFGKTEASGLNTSHAHPPNMAFAILHETSDQEHKPESVDGLNPAPPPDSPSEDQRNTHPTPVPPHSRLSPSGWCRIVSIHTPNLPERYLLNIKFGEREGYAHASSNWCRNSSINRKLLCVVGANNGALSVND